MQAIGKTDTMSGCTFLIHCVWIPLLFGCLYYIKFKVYILSLAQQHIIFNFCNLSSLTLHLSNTLSTTSFVELRVLTIENENEVK